ncbi:MAG: hypothetical protein H7X80_11295 [bacterium]|nr:hypothetical protein [Candidatus Kapabacteria bacterium]
MNTKRRIQIGVGRASILAFGAACIGAFATGCINLPAEPVDPIVPVATNCVKPISGLLSGWWAFDEGADTARIWDRSGNMNTGDHFNGVMPNVGTFGSGGLSFDGSKSYIEIPNSASLNFSAGHSLGMTFWIKCPSGAPTLLESVIDKRVGYPAPLGYHVFLYQGKVGVQIADGVTYANYIGPALPLTSSTKWTFVAISINRGPTPRIDWSIDGVTSSTPTPTMPMGSLGNTAPLRIAAHSYAYDMDPHFKGTLDEVAVYKDAIPSTLVEQLHRLPMCK